MDPTFPRILFAYGRYLAANGELTSAAEYLRQAVTLEGGHNPRYVAELRKVQRQVDPVLEQTVPLAQAMRSRGRRQTDPQSVVSGQSVSVRVDFGGRRVL